MLSLLQVVDVCVLPWTDMRYTMQHVLSIVPTLTKFACPTVFSEGVDNLAGSMLILAG
jgi:hypothetical protein